MTSNSVEMERGLWFGGHRLLWFTIIDFITAFHKRSLLHMEQESFPLGALKKYYEEGHVKKILFYLSGLKKHLKGAKNVSDVDRGTYEILINLIKYPNAKIMDISMSILANCCVENRYREMFKELGGIPPLILIIKTIDNDDILCRAYRLLGNLASNYCLASALNEYNIGFILLKSLDTLHDKSSGTLLMLFRAIKKLWTIKEYRSKMVPEHISDNLSKCLDSMNSVVVIRSLEALTLLSTVEIRPKGLQISKELLAKLVELSKNEETNEPAMKCLSNLICYQTRQVWNHLEGSGLAETFIEYIRKKYSVNTVVLEAFFRLCSEGAVRNKVKYTWLLPRLMTSCDDSNTDVIIRIFYLFQYDTTSIAILARDKEFVSLLIRNVAKKGAVCLLSVVSRLEPPVRELLSPENLNVLINNKECHRILRTVTTRNELLNELIVSGRIWEISKVNCLGTNHDQYSQVVIERLLLTGETDEMENAVLAVPFLVKPRHITVYNFLAINKGIAVILRLLKEKAQEERILATIVKLICILQKDTYSDYKHSSGVFDDSLLSILNISHETNEMKEDFGMEDIGLMIPSESSSENPELTARESVTFELDCGSCVTVDKNLMCKVSPVLDAMLNGNFIESNQQKVRLSCCSVEALQYLQEILLTNRGSTSDINIETHLELISLTDRFLISNLNDLLTVTLPINQSSCVAVLQWCRNSGYTKNNMIIKKRAYEFVFSSSSHLLLAMKNDTLNTHLVNQISDYISNAFINLL